MAQPECPYYGKCGGCTAQHIEYPLQVENKRKVLTYIVGHQLSAEHVQKFSANAYGYRNRMDFVFHSSGLGLRKAGQWQETVDVAACAIAESPINEILTEIRSLFGTNIDAFDPRRKTGTFRYALIRCTKKQKAVCFVVNLDSTKLEEAQTLVEKFAKQSSVEHVMIIYVPCETDQTFSDEFHIVKGNEMMIATIGDRDFESPVMGFFQNNTVMAEEMHKYVTSLLQKYPTQNAHLLDLYAGVGTFGINNAHLFSGVHIVESVGPAIVAAEQNIKTHGLKNATAKALDAQYLKRIDFPKKPLYVITDPPRSGMHIKTIEQLNALAPEVIIYISCNPQQLEKELHKFKKYTVKSAATFDLFPHTNHSESVVELVKKVE